MISPSQSYLKSSLRSWFQVKFIIFVYPLIFSTGNFQHLFIPPYFYLWPKFLPFFAPKPPQFSIISYNFYMSSLDRPNDIFGQNKIFIIPNVSSFFFVFTNSSSPSSKIKSTCCLWHFFCSFKLFLVIVTYY